MALPGPLKRFAELVKRRFNPDEPISKRPGKIDHFAAISVTGAILLNSTHSQRTEMPGLIALRVDMIIVATYYNEIYHPEIRIDR